MASATRANVAASGDPLSTRGLKWLRSTMQAAQHARAAAAPPRPVPQRFPAVRRAPLSGWWSARAASAAGVPLEEYLGHRLARYLSPLPITPDRLPLALSIGAGGTIVASPREGGPPPPPWLESYLRAHGAPALQPDVHLAHAEVAHLSAAIADQQRRVDCARSALDEVKRETTLDGPEAAVDGRPRVPPPWSAGIWAIAGVLLLSATWQLAVPLLDLAGVHTADLAGELSRNPAPLAFGASFALGAALSVFLFADLAMRRVRALLDAAAPASRPWLNAAAAFGGLALAAAVATSIVVRGHDAATAKATTALLLLALPLATSALLHRARQLHAQREDAARVAAAWDEARHRAVAAWTRRAAAAAAEERELQRLEDQAEAAARRLRALRQRMAQAERFAADAAGAETLALERLCHRLVSALELDRYQFLRHAWARNRLQEPRPQDPRRDPERTLGLAG